MALPIQPTAVPTPTDAVILATYPSPFELLAFVITGVLGVYICWAFYNWIVFKWRKKE